MVLPPERSLASARDVALRVLERVARANAFASRELDAEIERARLPPLERALASEIVYGVLRQRARLDRALERFAPRGLARIDEAVRAALRAGAYQLLVLERVPSFAAVDETVGWVKRRRGAKMAGLANALLRKLATDGEMPPTAFEVDPLEHLAQAESLPPWLARRVVTRLGADQALAFARAQNARAPVCLRANTRRTTAGALAERLTRDVEGVESHRGALTPEALHATGLGAPHHLAAYKEGLFAIQDEAAQLVAHLVAPSPGARVLDACAGVGTKSTHLAALMDDRGRVDAIDTNGAKLERCGEAARRLGLAIVNPARAELASWPGDGYDAVLLDAPCSGLGILRLHPEAKWRFDEAQIARLTAAQARLLEAAACRVRPGGALVYSVCTFTDEETDAVVAAFLRGHDDFAITRPLAGPVGRGAVAEPDGSVRTWTHRHFVDTFYAARLQRAAR